MSQEADNLQEKMAGKKRRNLRSKKGKKKKKRNFQPQSAPMKLDAPLVSNIDQDKS